ncbi:MAG: hypothetical protein QOJ25_2430 [Solirubrobacteraceae bacterium]|nr:hypothetical protein [Solirubrobacteraceae bacterium]
MNRFVARRPSPAMLVALVALFVALGSGAYAAISVPRNSVGTPQLKHGAVTGVALHDNAVTSSKVKDGALLTADFRAGQLPAGAPGPQGPKGDSGAQGAQGPVGPATGAAGGDLIGSFPNPAIAAGKVTTADFASGATAPNAAELGGFPASSFLTGGDGIAGGDLAGTYGAPTIKNGAVGTAKFGTIPAANVDSSDPSSVSLPTNTPTALPWNIVELDTDGIFSATHPTRLTAPVAGTYLVTGVADVAVTSGGASAQGFVELKATVNGGVNYFALETFVFPANGDFGHTVTGIVHLGAGDYVEEIVSQGATTATMAAFSSLSASWVGP